MTFGRWGGANQGCLSGIHTPLISLEAAVSMVTLADILGYILASHLTSSEQGPCMERWSWSRNEEKKAFHHKKGIILVKGKNT